MPDRQSQSGIETYFEDLESQFWQSEPAAAEQQRRIEDRDLLDVDREGRKLDREAQRICVLIDGQAPQQLADALAAIDAKIAADGDIDLSIRIGDTLEKTFPDGEREFHEITAIKLGDTPEHLMGGETRSRSVIAVSGRTGSGRSPRLNDGKKQRRGREFAQVENEARAARTLQARATPSTAIAIQAILASSPHEIVFSDLVAALGDLYDDSTAGKGTAKLILRVLVDRAQYIRSRKTARKSVIGNAKRGAKDAGVNSSAA